MEVFLLIEVAWAILRQNDRYLLAQRHPDDHAGGTWNFPGGKRDQSDKNIIVTANRELKEEVGLDAVRFRKLLHIENNKYIVHALVCDEWHGEVKPSCSDIIGVGWFTFSEMYALGHSLSPFVSEGLSYIYYLIQHYDHHPNEWIEQWTGCDNGGKNV